MSAVDVALTSLNGTFFSLCSGKSVDEVSERAVPAEELLVGAALCNFSLHQHKDMVSLWQEAHPVCDQDACLYSHQKEEMENQKFAGFRVVRLFSYI